MYIPHICRGYYKDWSVLQFFNEWPNFGMPKEKLQEFSMLYVEYWMYCTVMHRTLQRMTPFLKVSTACGRYFIWKRCQTSIKAVTLCTLLIEVNIAVYIILHSNVPTYSPSWSHRYFTLLHIKCSTSAQSRLKIKCRGLLLLLQGLLHIPHTIQRTSDPFCTVTQFLECQRRSCRTLVCCMLPVWKMYL